MPRRCNDVTEMIGDTPLVRLPLRNEWDLWLKMEKTNPGQSMKDRMALSMIEDAERKGLLQSGGTIIESSSGNTAIGLAMISAARGYKFIAVIDHHSAREKIDIIRAYGGEVVYVGEDSPSDQVAVKEREEMAAHLNREIPNSFFPNQADNPANPLGYEGMAEELLQEVKNISVLIGAIGTGGSLCGTARALKQRKPSVKVIAVEPKGSVIFGGPDGPYFQSGTGNPGSVEIADNVDRSLVDDHHLVSDKEAFNTARFLARQLGILVGGSAGGVIYKAIEEASKRLGQGSMVAIVADGGEKYISTVFSDDWMHSKKLLDISIETRLKTFLNLGYER